MDTETEPQNEHAEERPEIYDLDDPGRQPKTGTSMPEERREQGAEHQESNQGAVLDGDSRPADLRQRDEVLCAAVPPAAVPADAIDAKHADSAASNNASSLIVDMSLLDYRIRIENILQDKAKHAWQDLPLCERNEYAEHCVIASSTFEIARNFCRDHGFSELLCYDLYKERDQLC